jgi:hypothetical protein
VAVQTIEPGALLALVASRPLQFEAALEPGTFCPLPSGEKTACSLTGKPLPVLIWDLSNHNIGIYLYICIYVYIFM